MPLHRKQKQNFEVAGIGFQPACHDNSLTVVRLSFVDIVAR